MSTALVIAHPAKVWVRTGEVMTPYRLVDTRPLQADELGHVWRFDGFDMDAPHVCVLCQEREWRVYAEPCAAADQLAEVNAERGRYVAENRVEGRPPGWTHCGVVAGFGGQAA